MMLRHRLSKDFAGEGSVRQPSHPMSRCCVCFCPFDGHSYLVVVLCGKAIIGACSAARWSVEGVAKCWWGGTG
jgi:hypothetical protein